MYFKGIAAGKLPYIRCADIIIYSISTALVFHAVSTVKVLNFRTLKILAVITLKLKQRSFCREIFPQHADGMANSVDPDQTAPLGAV